MSSQSSIAANNQILPQAPGNGNPNLPPGPVDQAIINARVILNRHRATRFYRVPLQMARSMKDLLLAIKNYMYRKFFRIWMDVCGFFLDPEYPTILLLQQKRRRQGDRRLFITTDHTRNWDYDNWFRQQVLVAGSGEQLQVEIHVSNYHSSLRGEFIGVIGGGKRKRRTKDPWMRRKYRRFEFEYEEGDLYTKMIEDRQLRDAGLLPPMDARTEAKVYQPKEWQYIWSTLSNFAGPNTQWGPDDDFEADTDDEYAGRGEEIEDEEEEDARNNES